MKNATWLTLLFLILFIISWCSKVQPNSSLSNKQYFVSRLKKATIALQYWNGEHNAWITFCSGVAISKNKFLTAKHCTNPTDNILIEIDNLKAIGNIIHFRTVGEDSSDKIFPIYSSSYPHVSTVQAIDLYNDLALLTTNETVDVEVVRVGFGTVSEGQTIHLLGHTSGINYTYSVGTVATSRIMYVDLGGPQKMLQTYGFGWRGNSGGGVFDDQGNLLGIASYILNIAPGAMFSVHQDVINQFLKENNIF